MKTSKVLFVFLLLTTFNSCTYHYYSKPEAIRVNKKAISKSNEKTIIEDNDRILKVLTRDSNYSPLDIIYKFDSNDKQIEYTLIAGCDSCFQKYCQKELNNKYFKWKKLNDTTYISPYIQKRFLYIHQSTLTYLIMQHSLSKMEYDSLIKNEL